MPVESRKPILVVALGGNALIKPGQDGTIEEQLENLKEPLRQIARLSQTWRLVITHGNGPQVGALLLQQECCDRTPRLPLEILVAQTEGQIGYLIESTLDAQLMEMKMDLRRLFVTLITYVVVDENDPAFDKPTKPIGPYFNEDQAAGLPYPLVKTPKGFRRVVASPEPVTIVEKQEIAKLLEMDFIVICCGGGGIPVVREGRHFAGVDAVIDKDLASSRLAVEIGADMLLIATDVDGVYENLGRPDARFLETLSFKGAERMAAAGQFPAGSMEPKVKAAVRFVRETGAQAGITSMETIEAAASGRAGTRIVSES